MRLHMKSPMKWQWQRSYRQRSLNKWIVGSLLSVGVLLGAAQTVSAQISEADTGEFRRIEQPLGLKVGVAAAGAGLIGLELWWFLNRGDRS